MMKKIPLALFCVIALVLGGCSDDTGSGNDHIPVKYAAEFRGEWIRIDNGDLWYINGYSIRTDGIKPTSNVTLARTSANVITATAGSQKITLFAKRVANAGFNAQVVLLDEAGAARNMANRNSLGTTGQRPPLRIVNPEQPDQVIFTEPDPLTGEINVTGIIPGDRIEIIPDNLEWDGVRVGLTPGFGEDQNMGVIPLTHGDNFKVSIRMDNLFDDITELYADMIPRNYIVELENIGKTNCGDAGWELSWNDDDFQFISGNTSDEFANIAPGAKKQLVLILAPKRIAAETQKNEIKIDLWNYDSVSKTVRTWEDTVSVNYYSEAVPFIFRSEKRVQGVIKSKNGKSYYFNTTRKDSTGDFTATINIPWSADEYTVAFLGATIESESASKYSFAIDSEPPSSWESLRPIDFLRKYKPANEYEETAPVIDLSLGENSFMGYLAGNSIDYYKVILGTLSETRLRRVAFNINGGTGTAPATITEEYSTFIQLPDQGDVSRSGYVFSGWNTNNSGTGTAYSSGSSYCIEGNATLYAVWTPFFKITYDANGGYGVMEDSDFIRDIPGNLRENLFANGEYKFMGWAVSRSGFVTYTDGQSVTNLTITPGGTVTLYAVWGGTYTAEGSNFANKMTWIMSDNRNYANYLIEFSANETISPTSISFSGRTNINIILKGRGAVRIIGSSSNGALFTVNSGATLTLDENITLQGHTVNSDSLVRVNSGGTLIMNEGSKITGNTAPDGRRLSYLTTGYGTRYDVYYSTSNGGGVYVAGNFIMNGGVISGNKTNATVPDVLMSDASSFGGGVYVDTNGIFSMNGGEISGNSSSSTGPYTTSSRGGGVYVNGTFIMNNGIVYGNTASSSNDSYGGGVCVSSNGTFRITGGSISGNTASSGAELYGSAQYGVFDSEGVWNSNGTLNSVYAIHAENGVLR